MREGSVENDHLGDAGVERLGDGADLGQHASVEPPGGEKLVGLGAREALDEGVPVGDVGEQAIDVGQVDELVGAHRLGDLAGGDVGVMLKKPSGAQPTVATTGM